MDKLHNVDVDRIKQLAKAQGITLTYLCKCIDKYSTFLACVRLGKDSISATELEVIAHKQGTSAAYLMGETDDPQAADRPQPTDLDLQILQKWGRLSAEDRLRVEQFIDFTLSQHKRQPHSKQSAK